MIDVSEGLSIRRDGIGMARIGIFGGTFDPVHLAHLVLAEQCREQAGLDQVWFVPAARPPHKAGLAVTPFARRAEMLALAIAGQPAFRVELMEKDRPGLSYTAETVAEIARRGRGDDLRLIIGSDTLADLPQWYQPRRILELAGLLVVARRGCQVLAADEIRTALSLPADFPIRIDEVQVPLIDISSSDLRRRAAERKSLRFLTPRAVECYIEQHGLYPGGSAGGLA
jgi:nicotinate-nucleotide adenylyltransferase